MKNISGWLKDSQLSQFLHYISYILSSPSLEFFQ